MARRRRDYRGGAGRVLGLLGMRVRLQGQQFAVWAEQLVFVELAGAQSGHENLPEAAAEDLAHRHAPAVPAVELADHADPPSIGSPDREGDALHPFVPDCMCAELLIAGEVIALDQQMNVE